jgi:putative lipoic acid-binding regulatory protein
VPEPDAPRIEFPCRYPVKVMGENREDFAAMVVEVGQRHAPDLDPDEVSERPSRNGRWLAVTLVIEARSEDQLRALHADLKATGRVTLVL